MIDEREIIRKLRQGEDDAFRSIYFEYYGMLYHLGQRYLSDSVETKEILQRVFLKLWEIRGQLKEGSNVRNYLFTLVKNSCLNAIKRKQLVLRHNEKVRWLELQYQYESLDRVRFDYMEIEELQEKIDRAIKNLPEHCRRVFCLSRFDEMKNREIAEQLGVSVKTVEAHLTKALKLLRDELKEYLPLISSITGIFF